MRLSVWLVLSLGLSVTPAWANENMRIAVVFRADAVTVSGKALSFGPDGEAPVFTSLPQDKVELTRDRLTLMLEKKPLPLPVIRFHADDETIAVNGAHLRGDVVVSLGKGGLDAVNVIDLEDYLVGVLGGEMPKSFPLEALKAQAIAARTYALNKKLELYGQPFFLGATVLSQVYKGLSAENPRTRQAVEETRGQVLTFQLQPIESYFHASCGGHTESGLDALGRDLPYLQSVECPCHSLKSSHWNLTVSNSELKKSLGVGGPVQVQARTATGRVRRLQVGSAPIDAVRLRERIGYARVKSLAFELEINADGVRLSGTGFGHGAGLCQMGAKMLAERGDSHQSILAHYYPNTELQQLY
jgi:stage II sporulation protein D